jgi:hypothetical protein
MYEIRLACGRSDSCDHYISSMKPFLGEGTLVTNAIWNRNPVDMALLKVGYSQKFWTSEVLSENYVEFFSVG